MKDTVYKESVLTESYWPANTSNPPVEFTLQQALREAAREVPNRLALIEGLPSPAKRRSWTYKQFLTDAEKVAQALLNRFNPGERLALWSPNCPEWLLLEFGCAIAGIVFVTVNPALQKREIKYILEQAEANGIFVAENYRGYEMLAAITDIRNELPLLREVVCLSEFDEFIQSNSIQEREFPEVKPRDPAVIMFTSGTTGNPKGALLHHSGIINSALYTAERAGMETGGVWVNSVPMFHASGYGVSTLGIIMKRGLNVLLPYFDPLLVLELIEKEKGTFTLLVPTMLEAVLNHPERNRYNISSLKNVMAGGAKVDERLARRVFTELGCGLSIVTGMTETHGPIVQTHLDDSIEDRTETVGQALPNAEIKVVDPINHRILPVGIQGEVCFRGLQTMIGYYNMPEETRTTLKDDGWLHSGDLGIMDERGFLKITGRIKDMINRGGEKIFPVEIENLLKDHPKIEKVAVVGVPDHYWGEQVGAVIIPKSPLDQPTPEELTDYCISNLASFKKPKFWYFTNEFPFNPSGKLQKFKLVERIKSGELKPITD